MQWNWQQPEWPDFIWQSGRLIRAEEQFLLDAGRFAGIAAHLDRNDNVELTVDALSVEAITTSEIEGELLDRASVQSSIRQNLGLPNVQRRAGAAEQGIAEMMVDLHHSFAEPLSDQELFDWRRMLTRGRRDLNRIGQYRTHPEPMQIVSGPVHAPEVHFEAPPSAGIPNEMSRFVDWFNRTAPDGPDSLPALARAGIAHNRGCFASHPAHHPNTR